VGSPGISYLRHLVPDVERNKKNQKGFEIDNGPGDNGNREVFDKIAQGWYNYRHWTIFRTELEQMAARWKKGKLLNVGCGHGADFLPFAGQFDLFGVDFSTEMIKLARKYAIKHKFSADLKVADARSLPYPDNMFDWAIAVATYHHLKGASESITALRELKRVLNPGGEAFITVWNRCQPRFWLKRKETMVLWRSRDRTLYRYYYLYTYSEFVGAARQAGFRILKAFPESSYRFPIKYFSRNICLQIKKEKEEE
jgi:tRNA (uracil-5-)-methyltransferase TRM9